MRDLLRNSEYLSEEWGVFKSGPFFNAEELAITSITTGSADQES